VREKAKSKNQTEAGNEEEASSTSLAKIRPQIKNKMRRTALFLRQKHMKSIAKRKRRQKRKRDDEKLGDKAPPRQIPRTIENTREADETVVEPGDEEVLEDEANDEFAEYFNGQPPKTFITTSFKPSSKHKRFVSDLLKVFPNSHYYKRRKHEIKKIVEYAKAREFTNIIVTHEDRKKLNGLLLIHLPDGPTAHFKLSSIELMKDIKMHGKPTDHNPEIALNRFTTRMGHTVGRMFASLFIQTPQFKGRQIATFHNQRDFIFFRYHRWIIEEGKADKPIVRLQEMGPRFCLKLRSLQQGTFDTLHGEYIWVYKKELESTRRRFFL